MTKTDAVLNFYRAQLHSAIDSLAGLNAAMAEQNEVIEQQKKKIEELTPKTPAEPQQ